MIRIVFVFALVGVTLGVLFEKCREPAVQKEIVIPVSPKVKVVNVSAGWMRSVRKALPEVLRDYKDDIAENAELRSIDPRIVTSMLVVESMGDPLAETKVAKGCMQTTAIAEADVGMSGSDTFDCPTSILVASKYLAALRDRYRIIDPLRAAVAYTEGPTKTKRFTETQIRSHDYYRKVRMVMEEIPINAFL